MKDRKKLAPNFSNYLSKLRNPLQFTQPAQIAAKLAAILFLTGEWTYHILRLVITKRSKGFIYGNQTFPTQTRLH